MGKLIKLKDAQAEFDSIRSRMAKNGMLVIVFEDDDGGLNIASINCKPQEAIAATVAAQAEFADEWRGLI